MTNEELVVEIQQGHTEKLEDLWTQNLRFIKSIASEFHAGDLTDDILQEAYFGLMAAVEKFDVSKGFAFTTFANYYVRNAMRRFLIKARPGCRLPEYMVTKVRKYEKFVANFFREFGRTPTEQEARVLLRMPDIQTVKKASMDPASLDKSFDNGSGGTLEDLYAISDDDADQVIESLFREQLRRDLWDAVDELPERWGQVIRAKYQDDKTYVELAEEFGVSDQAIRSNVEKGMRRLRSNKKLLAYRAAIYGAGISGVSLASFTRTWTSSTERTAIWLMERND